jgi:AcrR family transcriptional regulator
LTASHGNAIVGSVGQLTQRTEGNPDKRSRLVDAAIDLAHRQGFGAMSLADISREAGIPLGNIYYYFKTKDDIGEAIVDRRLFNLVQQRESWDRAATPKGRLCACVQGVFDNRASLAERGCAVGTLCSELNKSPGRVARRSAEIFSTQLAWIESQFQALGKGSESRGYALHLLAALQGVSVLAHTFHDPDLIVKETDRLKRWIQGL